MNNIAELQKAKARKAQLTILSRKHPFVRDLVAENAKLKARVVELETAATATAQVEDKPLTRARGARSAT